jgi:non-specific serine/threonine protein kinase/serine/threonine-protein kinase
VTDESVFAAALAIPDPAQRAAYLDRACAGRPDLRREVEELLSAHAADNPPDRPPADLGRTGAYEPPAERPGASVGPYKLLQQIGEGGMGTVFMAEQTAPVRRKVALKVIKPGMDTAQVVARFEQERQALALMDHPNIAKVLDAGTTESGHPYFVMELVKGVPLTKFCDDNQLTPRERLELFVPVCQAIQHAHQKGVIHRDIKPANVLVAPYDGKPVPRVIDFGVAKAMGQPLTERTLVTGFGNVVGTLEYMSPEQAELNQLDIDTRSDVYSLGVLLYELLTGTTPLDRKRLGQAALLEVLRVIREEEPPRPSVRLSSTAEVPSIAANRGLEPRQLSGLVRGELDWIAMKALEKDRTRRYESAAALGREIQRYLDDEPVEACPPSLSYRLRKSVRKHRNLVATATAFALVLVLCTVVTAWEAVLARQAEKNARIDEEAAQSAEKRARDEKARAEQHAATVQAWGTFFSHDLLFLDDTVHPRIKGNEELLVVVNRMARKLEGRFRDQPEVELLLRDRVCAVYHSLHLFAAAKPHLERELALCRQLHGEEEEDTLLLKNRLAELYSQLGEYAKAGPLFLSCLDAYRHGKGGGPDEVQDTLRSLAEVYLRTGECDRAEAMFLDNLRRLRAEKGEEQANLADAMIGMGDVCRAQGKQERAEGYYRKSWEARRTKCGSDSSQTMKALAALADFYCAQRNYEQVELLFKEQKEDGWGLGFRTEEETARGLDALAASRLARKQYPEAEEVSRRSVEIWEEVFPDGWRHFSALSLLGGSLLGQSKWADAESPLVQGYQGMKERQGQIPPQEKFCLIEAVARLVQLYQATGKKDKAAEWGKKLEEMKAATKPPVKP